MSKNYSGSPVARHFVFVTEDGAFVVQLGDTQVQDLLTGRYQQFEDRHFGHPITDYELNQLKSAGRVERYNRNYVWLHALPEPHAYDPKIKTQEYVSDRVRTYYLNTTLPKSQLDNIQALLKSFGLDEQISAEVRGGLVAITGKNGNTFAQIKEAEAIQRQLTAKAPDIFQDSVVAFIETSQRTSTSIHIARSLEPVADLTALISSQSDTTVTQNKQIVILVNAADERSLIHDVCLEMKMHVQIAKTGQEALEFLEDRHPDLLLMDLKLPDMHGWAMLAKVKEISALSKVPIIVIAEQSAANQQSLALTVAQIDVYLIKPISKARLRQNIWLTLKNRAAS